MSKDNNIYRNYIYMFSKSKQHYIRLIAIPIVDAFSSNPIKIEKMVSVNLKTNKIQLFVTLVEKFHNYYTQINSS